MTAPLYTPPTKRRAMTRARRARVFLREDGRCYVCSRQIRAHAESYHIEHPDALALGGADEDVALRIICVPCHKAKTAADKTAIAARNRAIDKGYAGKGRKSGKMPGGRASRWKKRIDGRVVDRETGEPV